MINAEIIIPCYNESENINLLFMACSEVVKESNFTINFIFVDNGSTDNSYSLMNKLDNHNDHIKFLHLSVNQGYGGGILAGLRITKAPVIGWTHADLQTPIGDCLVGLNLMTSNYGFVKGIRLGRTQIDRFFTKGMELFESILFGFKLNEINAQPTLIRREFFEGWDDPPKDFSLDLYALVMAKKHNIGVNRFSVQFLPRRFGNSKWNLDFKSRIKFITRVINYSVSLRRVINENL